MTDNSYNSPKATFSFHKIATKNIQMPTLYTNLSLYMTYNDLLY